MTFEQIETFLTIVECGTISNAADILFVSQSTVSNRIKLLEEELAIQLIIRKKGIHSVELTPHGKEFINIAKQWILLWNDTHNIKSLGKIQTLNIGSVDIINNFTFVPLFQKYLKLYKNTKLSINTFHSSEIHTLVENHSIDIGFVFSQIRYKDIISKPVYRELMYLICHKDSNYYDNIHPSQLDKEKEIFLRWGQEYQQWHDLHWNPYGNSLITVNTGFLLSHYLNTPDNWAIAPMSVISALKQFYDIACYRLADSPPPQICYQLTHRYPKSSHIEAINIFENELLKFIKSNENICRFEPWMLEKQ